MKIDKNKAKLVGDQLNINWDEIDFDQFVIGINVELEHGTVHPETNITDDDLEETAKIGLVHLNELPDYYTRLLEMEKQGEEDKNMGNNTTINMKFKPTKDGTDIQSEEYSSHIGFGKLPKIMGGNLMKLLAMIIPALKTQMEDNPFDVLQDKDFGDDKPCQCFKDLGGCKAVVAFIKNSDTDRFAEMLESIENIRIAEQSSLLREIFSFIHSAKKGKRVAFCQTESINKLNKLAANAISDEEKKAIEAIKKQILLGSNENFDAASYRTQTAFASYVPNQNVRLAYTSLSTQDGEPFLLCPKARYQIGVSKPMEISKCRDNCIDSRTTTDGKTVCAFAEWLKLADTQQAVNERMEVHRSPDNKENLLTLNKNERSKPLKDNEKSWEERFEEMDYSDVPEKSLEARLDDASEAELGHHGEHEEESLNEVLGKKLTTAGKKKTPKIDPEKEDALGAQIEESHENDEDEFDDATIEAMLEDDRVGLTEEELDMLLDEWLAKKRDE